MQAGPYLKIDWDNPQPKSWQSNISPTSSDKTIFYKTRRMRILKCRNRDVQKKLENNRDNE